VKVVEATLSRTVSKLQSIFAEPAIILYGAKLLVSSTTLALEHELGNQAGEQAICYNGSGHIVFSDHRINNTQSWFQEPYQINNAPQYEPQNPTAARPHGSRGGEGVLSEGGTVAAQAGNGPKQCGFDAPMAF